MRVQCSTCLELLTPSDDLTCTPCGHVFHMACVVQWFENKKNCPQCRAPARQNTLRKIYLAETDGDVKEDANALSNQLDNAKFQLRLKETEKSKLSERNKQLEGLLGEQKAEIKTLEQNKRKYKETSEGLKAQNRILQEEKYRYEDALKEANDLRYKLDKMKGVELAVKGLDGDLNQYLSERGAFDRKTKDVAVLVLVLKKKLAEVKKERVLLESRLRDTTGKHERDKKKITDLEIQISEAQANSKSLENNLWRVQEDLRSLTERQDRQDDDTLIIAEQNSSHEKSPSPVSSLPTLSPPSVESPVKKLPSFKLVGSVKRALSPDGEERVPLMAVMNHSSARLGMSGEAGGAGWLHKKQKSSLHYDGLGGRARLDEFPQPRGLLTSSQSLKSNKTIKPQRTKLSSNTVKQNKTIDKFFGSFDTP